MVKNRYKRKTNPPPKLSVYQTSLNSASTTPKSQKSSTAATPHIHLDTGAGVEMVPEILLNQDDILEFDKRELNEIDKELERKKLALLKAGKNWTRSRTG